MNILSMLYVLGNTLLFVFLPQQIEEGTSTLLSPESVGRNTSFCFLSPHSPTLLKWAEVTVLVRLNIGPYFASGQSQSVRGQLLRVGSLDLSLASCLHVVNSARAKPSASLFYALIFSAVTMHVRQASSP